VLSYTDVYLFRIESKTERDAEIVVFHHLWLNRKWNIGQKTYSTAFAWRTINIHLSILLLYSIVMNDILTSYNCWYSKESGN